MGNIDVRPLLALEDMRAMITLQNAFWGEEAESIVPAHMLFSLANHGGHVLGAFGDDKPVGMLVGLVRASNRPSVRWRSSRAFAW